MSEVIVYTTDPCGRCGVAKGILERHGARYEEVNLAKDPVGRAELAQRTGLMTFPQIVIGDVAVGGLDDLRAADESGRLSELLAA
ncbi:MAG: glutaredoxin 3 [Solirubrobacteraceae bacterium]|jgi:glutaredoxin 3|nr:glutaredoxin 3 [Solirubrobacteraceae bacterium]MDX6671550.1 glutaredoxin 3 [Solirubrobacteraceae bacterium]